MPKATSTATDVAVAKAGRAILMNALAEEPITRAEWVQELGDPAVEALRTLRRLGLVTEGSDGQIDATRAAEVADEWSR